MKKVLYALLMTIVMVGMSACSNKMDLSGTTWSGTQSIAIPDDDEGLDVNTVITFSNATDGNMRFTIFGESVDQAFTYVCDKKGNGTIYGTDEEDGSKMESEFVVEGDKLTIVEDGDRYEFTKQ